MRAAPSSGCYAKRGCNLACLTPGPGKAAATGQHFSDEDDPAAHREHHRGPCCPLLAPTMAVWLWGVSPGWIPDQDLRLRFRCLGNDRPATYRLLACCSLLWMSALAVCCSDCKRWCNTSGSPICGICRFIRAAQTLPGDPRLPAGNYDLIHSILERSLGEVNGWLSVFLGEAPGFSGEDRAVEEEAIASSSSSGQQGRGLAATESDGRIDGLQHLPGRRRGNPNNILKSSLQLLWISRRTVRVLCGGSRRTKGRSIGNTG